MRLINKMILPVAAILAITSCAKENTNDNLDNKNAIRFVADQEITRTHFGEKNQDKYPTYWTGNESVTVALNYNQSAKDIVSVSADFKSASFSAVLSDDKSGSYSFCAVAPSSSFKDMSVSNKRIMIDVPSEQVPLEGSCDEAAQVIAAYSEHENAFPSEVALNFKHLTAYGLLSINNLEAGAVVSSIKLTSSISISSRAYWFPETGDLQLHPSKSESYINLTTNIVENIWFAIVPVDLSNTTMNIDVTTDKGVYSKSVIFPSGRTLLPGHIAQMSFDFTGITPETATEPIALYEVWEENDKAVGVVFWVSDDGASAKIVSLDRTDVPVAWSTEGNTLLGVNNEADGAVNTAKLKASVEPDSMPVLSFCQEHGDGWYWPARYELQAVFEAYNGTKFEEASNERPGKITDIEKAAREYFDGLLTSNGGVVMNTAGDTSNGDSYWTSHEADETTACYVRFGKRLYGADGKKVNASRYGRCVKVVTR